MKLIENIIIIGLVLLLGSGVYFSHQHFVNTIDVDPELKAEVQVLRLDELVGQALGEYQDRMESGGLVVVSDKMQEVWAMADGRHMWRIIENLFSNVCKYICANSGFSLRYNI